MAACGELAIHNHFIARPSPYSSSAAMVRIKKVTHDQPAEVVFELAVFDYQNTSTSYRGCFAYRSDRIPDLYSVQPQPVENLMVQSDNGTPTLEFTANPSRTYRIEASTDLMNWAKIGMAELDKSEAFRLVDADARELPVRYYRVVTE